LFTIALVLGFGHDARMTKRDAARTIREQDLRGLKYFD
jgi:hypothetical protein